MLTGQQVRFTTGPLGLVTKDTPTGKFEEKTVAAGETGEYIGPHPSLPGWSLIAVGDEYICPCHPSHFEEI